MRVLIAASHGIPQQYATVLEVVETDEGTGYRVHLEDSDLIDLISPDMVMSVMQERTSNPYGYLAYEERDGEKVAVDEQRVYFRPVQSSMASVVEELTGEPLPGFETTPVQVEWQFPRGYVEDGKVVARNSLDLLQEKNIPPIYAIHSALKSEEAALFAARPDLRAEIAELERLHGQRVPPAIVTDVLERYQLDTVAASLGFDNGSELFSALLFVAQIFRLSEIDVRQLPERPQTIGFVPGNTTALVIPGQITRKMPARYAVVEIDNIIASHLPTSMGPLAVNPAYPSDVQEREYHKDLSEAEKVRRNARQFSAPLVINTNPDAVNGAPVVTEDFVVLGGNSRAMTIRYLYDTDRGQPIIDRLNLLCSTLCFGISVQDLKNFRRPVLVRVLSGVTSRTDKEELRSLVRALNVALTQEIDYTQAMSAEAAAISADAFRELEFLIASTFKDQTIAAYLRSSGSDFSRALMNMGVFTERNSTKYVYQQGLRKGSLTPAGILYVENLLMGRLLSDSSVLGNLSNSAITLVQNLAPIILSTGYRNAGMSLVVPFRKALMAYSVQPSRTQTLFAIRSQDGQTAMEIVDTERSRLCYEILLALQGRPAVTRSVFFRYLQKAQDPAIVPLSGQVSLFGGESIEDLSLAVLAWCSGATRAPRVSTGFTVSSTGEAWNGRPVFTSSSAIPVQNPAYTATMDTTKGAMSASISRKGGNLTGEVQVGDALTETIRLTFPNTYKVLSLIELAENYENIPSVRVMVAEQLKTARDLSDTQAQQLISLMYGTRSAVQLEEPEPEPEPVPLPSPSKEPPGISVLSLAQPKPEPERPMQEIGIDVPFATEPVVQKVDSADKTASFLESVRLYCDYTAGNKKRFWDVEQPDYVYSISLLMPYRVMPKYPVFAAAISRSVKQPEIKSYKNLVVFDVQEIGGLPNTGNSEMTFEPQVVFESRELAEKWGEIYNGYVQEFLRVQDWSTKSQKTGLPEFSSRSFALVQAKAPPKKPMKTEAERLREDLAKSLTELPVTDGVDLPVLVRWLLALSTDEVPPEVVAKAVSGWLRAEGVPVRILATKERGWFVRRPRGQDVTPTQWQKLAQLTNIVDPETRYFKPAQLQIEELGVSRLASRIVKEIVIHNLTSAGIVLSAEGSAVYNGKTVTLVNSLPKIVGKYFSTERMGEPGTFDLQMPGTAYNDSAGALSLADLPFFRLLPEETRRVLFPWFKREVLEQVSITTSRSATGVPFLPSRQENPIPRWNIRPYESWEKYERTLTKEQQRAANKGPMPPQVLARILAYQWYAPEGMLPTPRRGKQYSSEEVREIVLDGLMFSPFLRKLEAVYARLRKFNVSELRNVVERYKLNVDKSANSLTPENVFWQLYTKDIRNYALSKLDSAYRFGNIDPTTPQEVAKWMEASKPFDYFDLLDSGLDQSEGVTIDSRVRPKTEQALREYLKQHGTEAYLQVVFSNNWDRYKFEEAVEGMGPEERAAFLWKTTRPGRVERQIQVFNVPDGIICMMAAYLVRMSKITDSPVKIKRLMSEAGWDLEKSVYGDWVVRSAGNDVFGRAETVAKLVEKAKSRIEDFTCDRNEKEAVAIGSTGTKLEMIDANIANGIAAIEAKKQSIANLEEAILIFQKSPNKARDLIDAGWGPRFVSNQNAKKLKEYIATWRKDIESLEANVKRLKGIKKSIERVDARKLDLPPKKKEKRKKTAPTVPTVEVLEPSERLELPLPAPLENLPGEYTTYKGRVLPGSRMIALKERIPRDQFDSLLMAAQKNRGFFRYSPNMFIIRGEDAYREFVQDANRILVVSPEKKAAIEEGVAVIEEPWTDALECRIYEELEDIRLSPLTRQQKIEKAARLGVKIERVEIPTSLSYYWRAWVPSKRKELFALKYEGNKKPGPSSFEELMGGLWAWYTKGWGSPKFKCDAEQTANTREENPTFYAPGYMKKAAQMSLMLARAHPGRDTMTSVGKNRRIQLADGRPLSLADVDSIWRFLTRNQRWKNAEGSKSRGFFGNKTNPSKGYMAFLGWGSNGDGRALAWAARIRERYKKKG